MKRIIIGNGKVANVVKKSDGNDLVLPHAEIEITHSFLKLKSILAERIQMMGWQDENIVVLNTAAKISLEWCEENQDECYSVNVDGVLNLANAIESLREKYDVKMVHIGSGCIFDGDDTGQVFSETDEPSPACWYAETKAMADRLLLQTSPGSLVLRPRQLVSKVANPTNMLTKFLTNSSGKFITSPNSITCVEDLSEMLDHLVRIGASGIYNCANEGFISPFKVATMLKNMSDPSLPVEPVEYADYVTTLKVKRVNTLLDIKKLINSGYHPRTAEHAVDWCIRNYK